ncbi:MAG: substrate-binding domain-containing protein [Xanthomonadaceae bacterium]|nr:substrate-binding domain-containing protein [Xanthomonadaceae bacterium]
MSGWLVFLGLAFAAAPAADAQTDLHLHGSNTIGETLAPALVEAWLARDGFEQRTRRERAFEERVLSGIRGTEVRTVEVEAHGSGTAFDSLFDGRADIGMSSRQVRPAEVLAGADKVGLVDRPAQEIVLALDGLAIIVHPANPLRSLSKSQVRDIFGGRTRDWSELGAARGRIALHARDDKSGTWDSFRSMVLGNVTLSTQARRYESTVELAEAVAADPLAIGFVGLVGVDDRVRALAISDGGAAVAPNEREVAVEDYPLSRRLFLYLPSDPKPLAQEFVAFALSDQGQAIVAEAGFVSQRLSLYPAVVAAGSPADYRELVAQAERVSLNFRFGTGANFLDSKALRDLDRLRDFVLSGAGAGRQILLAGFADTGEQSGGYLALRLSEERADYIADQLVSRGLPVTRTRGFGGALPVAANDSGSGRERNRRVEVWLRPPLSRP